MPAVRRAIGQMLSGLVALATLGADALASPAHDYMLHCMGCHGATAEGVPGKVPPLAHTLIQFMRKPGRPHLRAASAWCIQFHADRFAIGRGPEIGLQHALAASNRARPWPRSRHRRSRRIRHVPMASVQATRREVVRELAATGSAPSDDY